VPSGSGHETSASARRSPRQRKRESSRNKSSTKTRRHTHRPEIREGHRATQGSSSGAIIVPSSRQEPSSRTLKRRLLPDRILRTSSHRSTLAVSRCSGLIRPHCVASAREQSGVVAPEYLPAASGSPPPPIALVDQPVGLLLQYEHRVLRQQGQS
jgi:hypothetical protein